MDIIRAITELMCNNETVKLHVEFWESNEVDDGEHLVKINMEKEYY
jgi:hypothetical protein